MEQQASLLASFHNRGDLLVVRLPVQVRRVYRRDGAVPAQVIWVRIPLSTTGDEWFHSLLEG